MIALGIDRAIKFGNCIAEILFWHLPAIFVISNAEKSFFKLPLLTNLSLSLVPDLRWIVYIGEKNLGTRLSAFRPKKVSCLAERVFKCDYLCQINGVSYFGEIKYENLRNRRSSMQYNGYMKKNQHHKFPAVPR